MRHNEDACIAETVTIDRLRKSWRNHKAHLKRKRRKNKEGRTRTGGGQNSNPPLTDDEALVLQETRMYYIKSDPHMQTRSVEPRFNDI